MSFKPVRKLDIIRTLSTGQRVSVGVLAQSQKIVLMDSRCNMCEVLQLLGIEVQGVLPR